MAERVHTHERLILSVGTQVVALRDVVAQNGRVSHPRGSVGVVVRSLELSFGHAHVFYPEVCTDRTMAALLLDVEPVGMVRGKSRDKGFLLDVNTCGLRIIAAG